MPLDAVLELKIDHSEIIKRLSGRRTCRGCGASSHVEFEKPKVAGVCDKCGGQLYQREDDKEEVLNRRLEIYSCLLYTSPSPRDRTRSRMPSSA